MLEALAEAGVGAEEMRELAGEAQREAKQQAQREAQRAELPAAEGAAAEEASVSAASLAEAAAAVVVRTDALAQRVRRRLQGRVVVTPHTGADHVCTTTSTNPKPDPISNPNPNPNPSPNNSLNFHPIPNLSRCATTLTSCAVQPLSCRAARNAIS